MIPREVIDRVRVIADPIVLNEGMELVDVEYQREARGWVLRLYLDKEGGVTLDDCVGISQELGRNLDIEDIIENPYNLEVSSAGLDRPLRQPRDFVKYRDRMIKVKTYDPIGGRRNFKGRLLGLTEGQIEMELDGKIVRVPLSNAAKVRLVVAL